MKKITLFLLTAALWVCGFSQKTNYMIVGTYTGGKSEGIYVYRFNSETGEADSINMVKTTNPSFLAVSHDEKTVYAVNELADKGDGGKISAFTFYKQDGRLSLINQETSHGDDPCYISVDKSGKWIAVANYSSGTLSIFPVAIDGGIGDAVTVIQHHGSSIDKERQEGPHVHCVIFSKDNKYLFATDLGLDKVMVYPFNHKKGSLDNEKSLSVSTDPGSGPRHLTFHPNNKFAYLMEEMAGAVSTYAFSKGKLTLVQTISSLPDGYKGAIGSADIHVSPSGNFLYASNRDASNTIAIFKIDPETGKLALVAHQSTLGRTPRNFSFDPSGNFLLVENQNSDEIVIFKVDQTTGLLTDSGKRIQVGKPVCIKWISGK